MELVWIVPVGGLAGVLFAAWLAWDVLRRDQGTPQMREVAAMIFEGANAFMRRQYLTIGLLSFVVAAIVGLLVGYFDEDAEMGLLTAIAFLVGAFCSALAGFIGMYVAVRANVRTASAATRSLREAIAVSLRGGAVSGFLIVP